MEMASPPVSPNVVAATLTTQRARVTSGTFGVCNASDGVAGCLPWRNFKVRSLRAA
jgi:hypothetical protein